MFCIIVEEININIIKVHFQVHLEADFTLSLILNFQVIMEHQEITV